MKFKMNLLISIYLSLFINTQSFSQSASFETKVVSFSSGSLMLQGIIYKPKGAGPFPAILFNHGSSFETHEASDALGKGPSICKPWMGVFHAFSKRTGTQSSCWSLYRQ